ncbi:MAG: precorrin-6y C5,15-methyltransferase (decarboxylating) subunit CbiE [Bacteroidota bacterium]
MNAIRMSDATPVKYHLVGIGNSRDQTFSSEVVSLVKNHRVFSGGNRHFQLVKDWIPHPHQWIPITGKMDDLMKSYERHDEPLVIFVSGDPFFYGFGNTLKRLQPKETIRSHSYFNCIQLLAHECSMDYSRIVSTSVHGRGWEELDHALMAHRPLIGVLTDANKSPARIAARLLDHRFSNYTMTIGEDLEGADHKVTTLSLEEAKSYKSNDLNCVLLRRSEAPKRAIGIADHEFDGLPGRPGMITKKPIRLATLSALQLHRTQAFWDVGSCTGSIAIEAKRMFPELHVTAFEKRPECEAIIEGNAKKFQAPGIQQVIANVFELDLTEYDRPHSIFIGGHGNRLKEMILLLDRYLMPGGVLVMNAVKPTSQADFLTLTERLKYTLEKPVTIRVDDFNPIQLVTAHKPTP